MTHMKYYIIPRFYLGVEISNHEVLRVFAQGLQQMWGDFLNKSRLLTRYLQITILIYPVRFYFALHKPST
jgi:hypothetical protein